LGFSVFAVLSSDPVRPTGVLEAIKEGRAF
jgi:hypothetical protein